MHENKLDYVFSDLTISGGIDKDRATAPRHGLEPLQDGGESPGLGAPPWEFGTRIRRDSESLPWLEL